MEQSYRKYLSFTQAQLAARLDKLKDRMTPLERNEILRVVSEERKKLRSEKAKHKSHDNLWNDLIAPLNVEIRTVQNILRYRTRNYPVPERTTAITYYRDILLKLKRLLTQYHKSYEATPNQLSKTKHVPNDGEHWSDWVPEKIRAQVYEKFNAIPHRFKAKTKVPFERKEKKSDWKQAKLRLARRLEQELHAAYKDLANDPTEFDCEDHHEYIRRMETAVKALALWEEDTPLPKTWQAMFGNPLYAVSLHLAKLDVE